MKKVFFSMILIIFFVGISSYSQNNFRNKQNPELHSKIFEYNKQNVFPQMNKWKQKIDNTLSKVDLDKLNSLREKRKECRSNQQNNANCTGDCKQLMRNNKAMKRGGQFKHSKNTNNGKNIKEQLDLCQNDELLSILNKYDNLVKEIQNEANELSVKWRNDRQNIREEFMKNSKNMNNSGLNKRFENRMENNNMQIARIFLWDENTNSPFDNSNIIDVKVYPNPFSEKTTISFTLNNSAKTVLNITNSNGDIVKKLVNSTLSSGEHSYELKSDNLIPGVYIYNLQINGSIQTGKIVLAK